MNADFTPLPPQANGVVTWIHLGDLHMVRGGEQNHHDLNAIIDEINSAFAGQGVSFVYLPGDVADDGSTRAYSVVRECLDRLRLPWCAAVGDHDVHERSFTNFKASMSQSLYSSFSVGDVRFFRLNAFSEPRPDSFVIDDDQLNWLEKELGECGDLCPVVLMHCYPSDLKQGGPRLTSLLHRYGVQVVDMGHTHYNEISNDGATLYCATRSTGQIEEGPVGYSVLSLDGSSFSWQFVRLGSLPLVSIVNPSDQKLLMASRAEALQPGAPLEVRVRVWGNHPIASVELEAFQFKQPLQFVDGLWTTTLDNTNVVAGVHELVVTATTDEGKIATDRIHLANGDAPQADRSKIDQENAIGEWRDRDLLGTQLGPNKNGRKW